jgi:hypothetical protein
LPKRLIDGEALWRSNKLNQVQPLSFRAEYCNIIPLAEADGTFEADPRRVWADVYSYNRPDVTVEMVENILSEFERVGMLVRKSDEKGKIWGIFIGMENRLPAKSQRDKYKQGNAKLFKDIVKSLDSVNLLQSNSRQNLDQVKTGLVSSRFGLDRKGLEDRPAKKIVYQEFIDDESETRRRVQEILDRKKQADEFAEAHKGEI